MRQFEPSRIVEYIEYSEASYTEFAVVGTVQSLMDEVVAIWPKNYDFL